MALVDIGMRKLGWFGASIGTSLAFERISNTGEFQENEGAPLIQDMESIWINLRTLIRNANNAVESQDQIYLTGQQLSEAVAEDWDAINNAVAEVNPNCELRLYLCTYEGINAEFPNANFRNNRTTKQLSYETVERDVISYFLDNYSEELLKFKWQLSGSKGCVLMTHLPLDLVSYPKFPSLKLLESHTGAVKERRHWHTKMNIKKDGPVIPFCRSMLVIFGDSSMFSPQPIKARKTLLEISSKNQWHPLTTMAKIEQDVKLAHEPHLLDFIKQYK